MIDPAEPHRRRPDLAAALMTGLLSVLVGGWVLWWGAILPRRSGLGHLIPSVAGLDGLRLTPVAWGWAIFAAALTLAALVRRPSLASSRAVSSLSVLALMTGLAVFVSPVGHHAGILGLALVAGVLVAGLGLRWPLPDRAVTDKWAVGILWAAVSVVHMIYSMHRHAWFGSGSWDHGCMVHNFYRASRFASTTSTVLGEVDFLGDHFMVGIYLYAPLMWMTPRRGTWCSPSSPSIWLAWRRRCF